MDWIFHQLEPPSKTITLSGASAPFGRPRQKPVVSDGVELREQTVRYPGNNTPTRHIFGVKYDDLELTGRWRDTFLGPDGAQKQVLAMQEFVEDQVRVLITWGNIISYTGYIKHFIPKREAPYEVSWELRFLVDTPVRNQSFPPAKVKLTIANYALLVQKELQDGVLLNRLTSRDLPGIHPDFLDSLDDFVSNIVGFTGNLVNLANQVKSFESALASDISKLRAAIGQVKTALLTISNTLFAAKNEALFIYHSADSDIRWLTGLATFDASATRAFALMAEFDRQCEIAERGKLTRSYVAVIGDSWEGISARYFSGPEGAGAIRAANGIRGGAMPIPGTTYIIPSKA